MPEAFPLLPPRAVFVDSNGSPVAGGMVYTYVTGTTTPKVTWQDAGQATQNANPVPLDASGSCLLFGTGGYSLVVLDAKGNAVPGYDGETFDFSDSQSFNGVSSSGGFNSTGYDSGGANYRITTENYGVILRSDDEFMYLLQTQHGDPSGTWNNYRPIYWNLANGQMVIDGPGAGVEISNGLVITTGNVVNIDGAVNIAGALTGLSSCEVVGQLEGQNTCVLGGSQTNPVGTQAGNWVFYVGGAAGGYSVSSTATLTLGTAGSVLENFFLGTVNCGSITGTGSTTSYNTTSDKRLKLDGGEIEGHGQTIDGLVPRWFKWKNDPAGQAQPGFFAQEVWEVWPWAVTRPRAGKEELAEGGIWQMDAGKLIPLLVAELKDMRRRLAKLEGEAR